MSEPVTPAAPATAAPTPEATTTPATPKAPASRADFVKGLNAKLGLSDKNMTSSPKADRFNALARGEAPKPAETAPKTGTETAETPVSEAETASETPAEATGETPAAEPEPVVETKEEAKTYAHQVAKLQLEVTKNKSEALKHKDTATQAIARAEAAEARLEAIAKDPVAALKHAGKDPVSFAEMLLDPAFKLEPEKPKVELPPEVQELIDEGKRAKAEAARKAEETKELAIRTENTKLVQSHMDLPEFVEKFPLVHAMPDGAAKLLAWIETETEMTGKEPSLEHVAKATNDAIARDLAVYLKNETARKALFANPELAEVLAAFGAKPATAPVAKPAETQVKKPEAKVETPAVAEEEKPRSESPLDTAARARKKTLTSKNTGSVPSRTTKTSSSAELAARLTREFINKQT